jgi:hypothetical protein
METLNKLLKTFLQPWSTIVRSRIGSVAKAVIVGCVVSISLLAVGWTLLSPSVDLGNRSVFSVLVSPDIRTIEAAPDRLSEIGTCSDYSYERPTDNVGSDIYGPTYCRGWTFDESYLNTYGIRRWTATKYRTARGFAAFQTGSSRNDALGHTKDIWMNAGSSLLMPIVVLLVMQMGVLVGYQYFRRSSKADASDGEVT